MATDTVLFTTKDLIDFSTEDFINWKKGVTLQERSKNQLLDETKHNNTNPHINTGNYHNNSHVDNTKPHNNQNSYHTNSHTNSTKPHNNSGNYHTNNHTNNYHPHANSGNYHNNSHTDKATPHNNTGHTNNYHNDWEGTHSNSGNTHNNTLHKNTSQHVNGKTHNNQGYGGGGHNDFYNNGKHTDNINTYGPKYNQQVYRNYTYNHSNVAGHNDYTPHNNNTPHTNAKPHSNNHTNKGATHSNNGLHSNYVPHSNSSATHSNNGLHSNYVPHTNNASTHSNNGLHSNAVPHTNEASTHNNNGQHSNYVPHNNYNTHNNTGFDHQNYKPSQPQIYKIDDGSVLQNVVTIGLFSYDKNNDGDGSQDTVSKTVKYLLQIRKIKNLDGSANISSWRTLINYQTTETYPLNTLDPLGTGNTNANISDGIYEVKSIAINDSITEKGVTKSYKSPENIVEVRIDQNKAPSLTVSNGNEFINFTYSNYGVMDNVGGTKNYIDTLYSEDNPSQTSGLFLSLRVTDSNINNWQKSQVYLQKPDGTKINGSDVGVLWENGDEAIISAGITKRGYAFIPKEVLADAGNLTGVKVVVTTTDYLDSKCTVPAGSNVIQTKVSSTDLRDLVINIDVSPPNITLSNNGGSYKKSHSTSISVTDNMTGVKNIYYQWVKGNGSPIEANWITTSNGATVTTPNGATGNYYLHVKAIDKSLNPTILKSNPFNIDNESPTVNINNNKAWTNISSVPVTISGTDNQSGLQKIEYMLEGATVKNWTTYTGEFNIVNEGITTVKARAIDNSGNVSSEYTSLVKIDRSVGNSLISLSTTSWTKGTVSLNISAEDSLSGVKQIKLPNGNIIMGSTASYTVSSNGTYFFEVTDNAGNSVVKSMDITNIDVTGASINLTPDKKAWTNTNISIRANAVDNQSGVKEIKLPNGVIVKGSVADFIATENGTYTFEVIDIVGNKSTKSISITNIDKTIPNLKLSLNSDRITNLSVIINANGYDGQSGVKSIKLPDGKVVDGASANYTVTENGNYSFEIEDIAGNRSVSSINVGNIIKINPVSGIDRFEYKLEGATVQNWTTYTGVFNVVNEGVTTIKARAIDKAGNISNEAISFIKIDRSKPINGTVKITTK